MVFPEEVPQPQQQRSRGGLEEDEEEYYNTNPEESRTRENFIFEGIKVKRCSNGAVVLAQLVEWSFPTPEVHSSNPVIGKKSIIQYQLYWKDKNKEKRGRKRPIFKRDVLSSPNKINT